MKLNHAQAQRLLDQYVNDFGQVYLEGHAEDLIDHLGFPRTDYWEPEELEAVQRLLELAHSMFSKPEEHQVLKFKKLDANATAPQRSKDLDAGYDITSTEEVVIPPGENYLVATGIAIETPPGTYAAVHPRSGYAAKHRVTVTNAPGTIDEGYRGEIKVNIINHGGLPFKVQKGMKIAQLVIQKYETPDVIEVDELSDTARGTSGHGSTGQFTPGFFPKGI